MMSTLINHGISIALDTFQLLVTTLILDVFSKRDLKVDQN